MLNFRRYVVNRVLIVGLGLGPKTTWSWVRKRSCLGLTGFLVANVAGKCPNVKISLSLATNTCSDLISSGFKLINVETQSQTLVSPSWHTSLMSAFHSGGRARLQVSHCLAYDVLVSMTNYLM